MLGRKMVPSFIHRLTSIHGRRNNITSAYLHRFLFDHECSKSDPGTVPKLLMVRTSSLREINFTRRVALLSLRLKTIYEISFVKGYFVPFLLVGGKRYDLQDFGKSRTPKIIPDNVNIFGLISYHPMDPYAIACG